MGLHSMAPPTVTQAPAEGLGLGTAQVTSTFGGGVGKHAASQEACMQARSASTAGLLAAVHEGSEL